MLMFSGTGIRGPQFGATYFAGNAQVTALQNALASYAQIVGDMNANPGTATGAINDSTVIAALYTTWKVADKVPGLKTVKGGLTSIPGVGTILNLVIGNSFGLLAGWALAKSQAPGVAADITKFIENNANAIAIGVNVASGLGTGTNTNTPGALSEETRRMLASLPPVRNQFVLAPTTDAMRKLAAFDPKLGKYRVAVPKGLGAIQATHQEIAPVAAAPGDAKLVKLSELEKAVGIPQWYQQPLVWLGIGVGVLGLGTGVYFLTK